MLPSRSLSADKFTPPQLARLWGISRNKVLTWIQSGELRAIDAATRRGTRPRYLIDVADVRAFEARRLVSPPTEQPRMRRRRMDDVIEFV